MYPGYLPWVLPYKKELLEIDQGHDNGRYPLFNFEPEPLASLTVTLYLTMKTALLGNLFAAA